MRIVYTPLLCLKKDEKYINLFRKEHAFTIVAMDSLRSTSLLDMIRMVTSPSKKMSLSCNKALLAAVCFTRDREVFFLKAMQIASVYDTNGLFYLQTDECKSD